LKLFTISIKIKEVKTNLSKLNVKCLIRRNNINENANFQSVESRPRAVEKCPGNDLFNARLVKFVTPLVEYSQAQL